MVYNAQPHLVFLRFTRPSLGFAFVLIPQSLKACNIQRKLCNSRLILFALSICSCVISTLPYRFRIAPALRCSFDNELVAHIRATSTAFAIIKPTIFYAAVRIRAHKAREFFRLVVYHELGDVQSIQVFAVAVGIFQHFLWRKTAALQNSIVDCKRIHKAAFYYLHHIVADKFAYNLAAPDNFSIGRIFYKPFISAFRAVNKAPVILFDFWRSRSKLPFLNAVYNAFAMFGVYRK